MLQVLQVQVQRPGCRGALCSPFMQPVGRVRSGLGQAEHSCDCACHLGAVMERWPGRANSRRKVVNSRGCGTRGPIPPKHRNCPYYSN